jgi:hypothetical protein
VAAVNFCTTVFVLSLSCLSSKARVMSTPKKKTSYWQVMQFDKSNNGLNKIFTIILVVGFATSMTACFFLNKEFNKETKL